MTTSERCAVVRSPVARWIIRGDADAVREIWIAGASDEPTGDAPVPGDPVDRARDQLRAYFEGDLEAFDLPLTPAGTPFQRRVWEELQRIPHGRTISYGELARRVGRPGAARAVGTANGRNPLPIVVPCHRVIASDGSLGGYAGGLHVKRWLLAHEGSEPSLFANG